MNMSTQKLHIDSWTCKHHRTEFDVPRLNFFDVDWYKSNLCLYLMALGLTTFLLGG